MWFIFPQIHGLGQSEMARRYAMSSLEEARSYLAHPLLGSRLAECTRLVCAIEGRTIEEIFGYPDYLKFRSSMTLFAQATTSSVVFQGALNRYFGGMVDPATMAQLSAIGSL